jgi:hypothetical protein
MKWTITVLNNVELDIVFEYEAPVPATHLDPPSGGYAVVTDIIHKGDSLLALVSESDIQDLETKVYDEYTEHIHEPPEY